MRLSEAVDLYLTGVSGRCTPRTKLKYEQELTYFTDYFGDRYPVEDITPADCIAFLSQWNHRAAKTKAIKHTVLRQLFTMLEKIDSIPSNPMLKIDYPKVPPIEDRGVKSMSFTDVQKMFSACESWTEKLCIGVLAYMGVRRAAANNLRWKDVDLETGYITFKEKGQKTIRKPIPLPLLELLKSYRSLSEVGGSGRTPETPRQDPAHPFTPSASESDYVIPSEAQTYTDPRNDRFIWRVVKRVGERAGVDTHCHAFRAAFAVHYLESHDNDTIGLQELMGHNHFETTKAYLRRLNREKAMERVRDLDWGVSLTPEGSMLPVVRVAPELAGSVPLPTDAGKAGQRPSGVSEDDASLKSSGNEHGGADPVLRCHAAVAYEYMYPHEHGGVGRGGAGGHGPQVPQTDSGRHIPDDSGQKNSMTPKKLRGRDSNPNSTTAKVSSKSQRIPRANDSKSQVSKTRKRKTL